MLLDLGVPPEERVRKSRLALGFSVLMLLFGPIVALSPRSRVQGFMFIAWGGASAASIAFPRPFQFRQAGILGRKLFRWPEIQDYHVSPKGNLTLKLSGEWISPVGNVPAPRRQEVASLIASQIAAQTRPAA